jgi:hypothetical protein
MGETRGKGIQNTPLNPSPKMRGTLIKSHSVQSRNPEIIFFPLLYFRYFHNLHFLK